jgi:hypothetical protein
VSKDHFIVDCPHNDNNDKSTKDNKEKKNDDKEGKNVPFKKKKNFFVFKAIVNTQSP